MDMDSVLAKIADSLEGTVALDLESLTDQFTVLSEDHARVDPEDGAAANHRIIVTESLGGAARWSAGIAISDFCI